jgi:RNA polymerase sigma factor (TIGR02999 family)
LGSVNHQIAWSFLRMAVRREENLTRILRAAEAGDPKAAAELLPLVYSELRRLAQARMAKTPPGNTLQPTALVHEAYMRLIGKDDPELSRSRGHFFAAAAQAMRDILVEQARRKKRQKHGGGRKRVALDIVDLADVPLQSPAEDILALDEALQKLEQDQPRLVEVVKLRFFAGLTTKETAAALGVSVPTVERDWRFARTLLYTHLGGGQATS